MSDEHEKLGFLCRWTLLTLAAALAGSTAVAVVLATARATTAGDGRLILSDEIMLPREPMGVGGCLVLDGNIGSNMLLSQDAGGKTGLVWNLDDSLFAFVARSEPGRSPVTVRGIPFGPLALLSESATFTLARPGVPVFLLDAHLAMNLSAAEQRPFQQWLAQLRATGETAIIYGGPAGDYLAIQDALRKLYPDTSRIFQREKSPNLLAAVQRVDTCLCKRGGSLIRVLTDQPAAARSCAEAGFATFLVGRPSGPAAGRERLTICPSLAGMKESVMRGCITVSGT